MGNTIRGKKHAKVMKIDGETIKMKTPIKASEVTRDYPGHVLLDSEAVKYYGVKAKPLEPHQNLQPKKVYFLIEPPPPQKVAKDNVPRRVRSSGIHMSAKERLESLMLSRRTSSDISFMRPAAVAAAEAEEASGGDGGAFRVKMRLPKAEVERLMRESRSQEEAAEKIMSLCVAKTGDGVRDGGALAVKARQVIFLSLNICFITSSVMHLVINEPWV